VAAQAPSSAVGFRVEVAKWLSLVRLLLGEVPEHSEFTAPGLAKPLAPYFAIAQAVRAGDLATFRCAAPPPLLCFFSHPTGPYFPFSFTSTPILCFFSTPA